MRALAALAAVLAAVLVAGALAAGPASAAQVYAGRITTERFQLVLELSDDGSAVQGLTYFLDLPCTRVQRLLDMGSATVVAQLPAAPPVGSRLLAAAPTTGGRLDATLVTNQARGRALSDVARARLTGSLTPTGGSGTIQATRTVVERATGRTLGTCTRTYPWRVDRGPGTVFGGRTTAGGPVVLHVTPDHRRVTESLIAWAAPCRRATFYLEPHDEWLLPFGLPAGGRFAKAYSYDAGAGGRVIGRFAGRVRATTASGTFRSRFVSRRDRCTLSPQRWTARTG